MSNDPLGIVFLIRGGLISMKTILDEQFTPITSMIGFLEVPLEAAVDASRIWRSSLYEGVSVVRIPESFPESLHRLEPLLHAVVSRELWVEAGRWTAYFNNLRDGTDPVGTIGHLGRTLGCRGLIIDCSPHTMGIPGVGQRFGAVQFRLSGPTGKPPLYGVRSLAASYDPGPIFLESGTVQPFEEVEAYSSRRIRDRFTPEMLERYCQALGVSPFEAETYGRAVLIEWPPVFSRDPPTAWSLTEAQQRLGIVPGEAKGFPW